MRARVPLTIGLTALAAALALPAAAGAFQVYTDVTSEMGIDVSGLGSGTAWSDLDGDGDQDLLVSTSTGSQGVYLYRNDGDGFTDVHASSGLAGEARSFAVGDYDNDGLDDVAMISFGYVETKLYHNIGGMQFDDISDTSGITGTYSWRCAWVDYDDDGLLDLHLCGDTNYLFRNLGDGFFEDCAGSAGFQTGGRSCAWVDYDNDGLEDCYIGDSNGNLLYHNLGDGTFEEVGAEAGVDDPYGTSGVCAGDFDGDGFFDLYSVNIGSPNNRLYHNQGDGTFEEITSSAGVGDVGDGRTATFLDIDYDGLVDLFSSNHVNPNRLYRNNGDSTFTDIADQLNIDEPPDPFGTGFADYDGDGDVDLFLATHFGNSLLRCDGMDNHWIVLNLVGTVSNRSAIGAVVRCTKDGLTTYQRVDGGHGMGDSDSKELEFGLGGSAGPFEIEILWPSGLVETYTDLEVNTHVDLVEGAGPGVRCREAAAAGRRPEILSMAPNPAGDQCALHFRAQPGADSRVDVMNAAGRLVYSGRVEAAGGTTVVDLPTEEMEAGVYLVRVSAAGYADVGRMVVLR
ncbi:MAG: FG-GAP-like repeat-containing protein [Candidatus Fermentibacteraceae bacterium]